MGLKDLVINEGETLSMEAQFKGFPDPDVKWYKDDDPFPEENTRKEDTYHFFTLENVNVSNSGVYCAVAKNTVGDCKTSAKVKVIKAPHFVKSLSDVSLVEK